MAFRTRRFSRRGRPSSRRRQLVWARSTSYPAATGLAPGTVTATNLLADLETQIGGTLMDCTVLRVRGLITAHVGAAPAIGATSGIVGFRVDDRLVVGLPAAQLLSTRGPGSTDRYGNWMHREYFFISNTAVGTGEASYMYPKREAGGLDVRARRKLDEQQSTLVMYLECSTGSTNTVNFNWAIDILLAMP